MEERSEIYRHAKTGGLYVVLANARLESNLTTVVVYKSLADGRTWVRPASEFYDETRFVPVPRALLKTWA